MEAVIFCVVIGLLLGIGFVAVGITIGRSMPNEEDKVDTEGDVLAAELRIMAASGIGTKEQIICRSAAEYIERGLN